MSCNNDDSFNSSNLLPRVGTSASELGISPVTSLSANLGSNLSIRRNLLFIDNCRTTKAESNENAMTNSAIHTTRMVKFAKLNTEVVKDSGSSSMKRFTATDKENNSSQQSCSNDYSLMSDNEVNFSKFPVKKQMHIRDRYPLEHQDPNSPDSGYSNSNSMLSEDSKSSVLFRFPEPSCVALKSTLSTDLSSRSRDRDSQSNKRLDASPRYQKLQLQHRMSTDSISEELSEVDVDEHFTLPSPGFQMDQDENAQFPDGFATLLSGPIYNPGITDASNIANDHLSFRCSLRRLVSENSSPRRATVRVSTEPEFNELLLPESGGSLKRSASEDRSDVFLKRCKVCTRLGTTTATPTGNSAFSSDSAVVPTTTAIRKTLCDYGFLKTSLKFQRSLSESAAQAIDQSTLNPNLIGDCSRPFALPLKIGKNMDQRNIDCHTLARLMRGEYDDKVASFKIIDCRYPYEYEAGHIRGAVNIYTPEKIKEELIVKKSLLDSHQSADPNKHNIFIFHCEFSSKRGPSQARYLRKVDRENNVIHFPKLDYPEIYLLDGGYAEFYKHYKELCDPCYYQKMIDSKYAKEMLRANEERKIFRRSNSWATMDDTCQPKRRNAAFKRLVL